MVGPVSHVIRQMSLAVVGWRPSIYLCLCERYKGDTQQNDDKQNRPLHVNLPRFSQWPPSRVYGRVSLQKRRKQSLTPTLSQVLLLVLVVLLEPQAWNYRQTSFEEVTLRLNPYESAALVLGQAKSSVVRHIRSVNTIIN